METLSYKTTVKAPIQKVWDMLWAPETYEAWTQFFSPGCQLKTDWEINGKTYFLDYTGNGMVSTIKSINPPFEVVFSHLGTFNNGIEDTQSREVKEWSGAEEQYFLRAVDENTTEIQAIVHAEQKYEDHMSNGFTKGFEVLRKLAEQ